MDQFVGGGTTAVEAKLTNRNFIGVDINPNALEITKSKLNFECEFNPTINIIQGDARNLSFIDDDSIDLICTLRLMPILFITVMILTAICRLCRLKIFCLKSARLRKNVIGY